MSTSSLTDRQLYGRLLRHAQPYWLHLIAVFVLSLLSTPLALLVPIPLKIAVDSVIGDRPLPQLLDVVIPDSLTETQTGRLVIGVVLLIAITLMIQLQSFAQGILTTFTGDRLVLRFRERLFWHVQRLSLTYHDSKGGADSVYRIQYDAPAIQAVAIEGLIPFISSGVKLVVMIVATALLSWKLALVALAVSPILFTLTHIYRPRLRQGWRDLKRLESSSLNVVHEVLSAMRVVKAFVREEHEHQRFVRRSTESLEKKLQVVMAESVFNLLVGLTVAIGTATVLFIGVRSVMAGALTLGELLLVMAYLGQLYEPLKTLGKKLTTLQGSFASAERAFAVLDREPDVQERQNAKPLARAQGAIELCDVGFSYDDKKPILSGLTLAVPAGSRVGISGRTGAGKTTLMSLLIRFYDPTSGKILLDGVDLREYKLKDLRNQFAIVLQDTVLFSTTIAENIAYGCADADQEAIIQAAQAANAHEFISRLPDGYATLVGERGMRLSGGERQRIALARAFLKDAPILILDEPTSAVDLQTEHQIMEALQRLMQGRTTFMIAHRLSTLETCTMRIDIREGGIAVKGQRPSGAMRGNLSETPRANLSVGPPQVSFDEEVPLDCHPATIAWRCLDERHRIPHRIESLKERYGKPNRYKSYVFRLSGAAPDGGEVVAKRCRSERARVERMVYEEVLPQLPGRQLKYYGFVEESDGEFCWLFLEEARGETYSPTQEHQRAALSHWLGQVQASAEGIEAVKRLPDRGPAYYRSHLRNGRQTIRDNIGNPALTNEDKLLLDSLLRQCDVLDQRWEELTAWCEQMPRTLVHGDLVGKNIRVTNESEGNCGVFVFDWECAGWGIPAPDLAQAAEDSQHFSARMNRQVYLAAIANKWPHINSQDIDQLARLGTLFRYLAAIDWASLSLTSPWVHKGMSKLRSYEPRLADLVRANGWEVGL